MCGIAGHLDFASGADRAVLERQVHQLEHRGPDSAGGHVSGCAAIGQTRLAVIDLVTGDPPITVAEGHVGVALNGEIYNYRELRVRLQAEGHVFTTGGDTEVLAHLAESTDPVELARSLVGMFAFATWDDRRERLVLARDHFGKKPLYYWYRDGRFVFGSEIKALLAHPHVPASLDESAIPAYLGLGYIPGPRTFYAGIHALPPGHVLVLERGAEPRLTRYWSPPVVGVDGEPSNDLPFDAAAAAVRKHLAAAVQRRLVADVPLGAFLSGGIDSSAIVALMSGMTSHPVRTFTIGFGDVAYDERAHARRISRLFGTDHAELVVNPAAVELVEELVWHYDEPFADSTAVPTYLLSKFTAGSVKVALSGDGGDELFAGYERFRAARLVDGYSRLPAALRRALARGSATSTTAAVSTPATRVRRFLAAADVGLPHAYRRWVGYTPDDLVDALSRGASRWDVDDFAQVWDATAGAKTLHRLLDLNLQTYLVGDLLPKTDRMSMAHGLEVRSPFLDVDLAEFALRLPPSMHIRRGRLKAVLKEAMRDLLPPEILDRPKRGFGVPVGQWFRGDLASFADSMLDAPSSRVGKHLDAQVVSAVLRDHRTGRFDHGELLWGLLTLEIFLRARGW